MKDYFGLAGTTCVVTGAATGMGKAAATMLVDLGAEVYAMDVNPVEIEGLAASITVNLAEKDSIDAAFAQVPEHVHAFHQQYRPRRYPPSCHGTYAAVGYRHATAGGAPKASPFGAPLFSAELSETHGMLLQSAWAIYQRKCALHQISYQLKFRTMRAVSRVRREATVSDFPDGRKDARLHSASSLPL